MKRIVISGAVLALAIAGTGVGSAKPAVVKINGGGQTEVPTTGGAGDTLGFTAQRDADGNVKGQFQYQDRNATAAGGTGQKTYHGYVTCVELLAEQTPGESGGIGVVGGFLRDGVTPFRLDVTDEGQGDKGSDLVLVQFNRPAEDGADDPDGDGNANDASDTDPCDKEDELARDLARGNVTIHKAKA